MCVWIFLHKDLFDKEQNNQDPEPLHTVVDQSESLLNFRQSVGRLTTAIGSSSGSSGGGGGTSDGRGWHRWKCGGRRRSGSKMRD